MNVKVLFDSAADAMLLVDSNGEVLQANTTAQQLLGYSEEQFMGLKVEALMPTAYCQHHQQYRKTYVKQPEKRPMGQGKNLVALTRNGKELHVDIGLSPVEFKNIPFIFITFHPIEKQIEAEKQLQLAQFATAFGVFDINFELGTLECDAYTQKLWGFKSDQTNTYDQFLKAINRPDQAAWQAAINKAVQPESDGEMRLEFGINNLLTQSEQWVFSAGKVYTANERAFRLIGVMHNVTERKQFEKESNAQRIEMEALSKHHIALQTASAIAHELNQPLTAISAYSEVALHEIEGGKVDVKKMRHCLTNSVTQAQRAGKSLHELLEYLQKGEVITEDFDINKTIKIALHLVEGSRLSGFHSSIDLEPNLPKVLANQLQIQKVLVNLLSNGLEASQKIGKFTGTVNVSVQTEAISKMVKITIKDNGSGLDKETEKRLFEPFFTTKPTGIGMGLTVSRTLIEANGGKLWFDAGNDHGATFHFTLPFSLSNKAP